MLVGFVELTPQQRRLVAALTTAGAASETGESLLERSPAASRTSAVNAREEIIAALTWARDLTTARPDSRIGIVIENLPQRRDEVLLLADELLCPALVFPAQLASHRPYEVSLGTALGEVPIVLAALDLIALAEGTLPAGDAAALLRSPYLAGAESARLGRAAIERDWLESGQREVTLNDVIAAAQRRSPELARQWQVARDASRNRPSAAPRGMGGRLAGMAVRRRVAWIARA